MYHVLRKGLNNTAEGRVLQEEAGKSLVHMCLGVFMGNGQGGGCKGWEEGSLKTHNYEDSPSTGYFLK